MALINCPYCGDVISSFAKKCPHCGRPIYIQGSMPPASSTFSTEDYTEVLPSDESADDNPFVDSSEDPSESTPAFSSWLIRIIIIAVLVGLGGFVYSYYIRRNKRPNTENHSIPKSEIPATIEEFAVDSCAQDSVPAPLW